MDMTSEADVGMTREVDRDKALDMGRRLERGPMKQGRVTAPLLLWEALEEYAALKSDSYKLLGGTTKFTISDIFEQVGPMYLRWATRRVGLPLPKTPKERETFVKRLAELDRAELLENIIGEGDDGFGDDDH